MVRPLHFTAKKERVLYLFGVKPFWESNTLKGDHDSHPRLIWICFLADSFKFCFTGILHFGDAKLFFRVLFTLCGVWNLACSNYARTTVRFLINCLYYGLTRQRGQPFVCSMVWGWEGVGRASVMNILQILQRGSWSPNWWRGWGRRTHSVFALLLVEGLHLHLHLSGYWNQCSHTVLHCTASCLQIKTKIHRMHFRFKLLYIFVAGRGPGDPDEPRSGARPAGQPRFQHHGRILGECTSGLLTQTHSWCHVTDAPPAGTPSLSCCAQ